MDWKKNWEEKLNDEFQNCSWEELQQLLKDAYDIALKDASYEHQYTHLIIHNLKLLAEYGIAQVLNTKPGTPAPLQIERGLAYIQHRYKKPSAAWAHWRAKGWY